MLEMIQDIKDNLIAENVLILQGKGNYRTCEKRLHHLSALALHGSIALGFNTIKLIKPTTTNPKENKKPQTTKNLNKQKGHCGVTCNLN